MCVVARIYAGKNQSEIIYVNKVQRLLKSHKESVRGGMGDAGTEIA